MSEADLVDGDGWISDESEFYGNVKMQESLERRVSRGAKRQLETPFSDVMSKRVKLEPASTALPSPSTTPEMRGKPTENVLDFLKSRPQIAAMHGGHIKGLNPAKAEPVRNLNGKQSTDLVEADDFSKGDPSAWQRSESIIDFLRRAPVADPATASLGPWLWVSNPKLPFLQVKQEQKTDIATFKQGGARLLEAFMDVRAKYEKANESKLPGTITRYMRPYREQLEDDLLSLAVKTGTTCGKWILFPSEADVARVWRLVAEATSQGKLGHTSKVATHEPLESYRVICVYTYNFADTDEVRNVLNGLLNLDLVSRDGKAIYYKCDAYTYLQINSENPYKIKASLYGSAEMLKGEVKAKQDGPILVALDLPGFGGSDDLGHYGPDEMLNTVSEAIVRLKAQYLIDDYRSRCLLVGHDWGGLLSYRIAAETLGLVHRVVAVNIGYAGQMPVVGRNKGKLALSAWQSVAPLLTQMLTSSYIFMFNLPYAIFTIMPLRTLEYLLDWCHREGHHRHKVASKPGHVSEVFLAESRASSFGPSSAECTSRNRKDKTYSAAVLARATTSPPGNWLQRIRLYREGLTSGKWTLAPELQRYRPAAEDEEETFKCPVTVLFGLQDPALDPRVVLDGVERYFTGATKVATRDGGHEKQGTSTASDEGASHIVRLHGCGHWSLLENPIGSGTLEKTLVCLLSQNNEADQGSLERVLAGRAQQNDLANWITIDTYK
ncbi:hypothetical protein B0A55_02312 [Friedmanniomyces simplex]|uniref:AB hydrolase-1 domain-containing protein n=1 Tax=Friedmanniomyces simplex TaxID=329884 RepID=A0A4U0XXX8_9PEZI|nr:hypothetical protein B0A55_02312 [Friedmanniomyces simplex]